MGKGDCKIVKGKCYNVSYGNLCLYVVSKVVVGVVVLVVKKIVVKVLVKKVVVKKVVVKVG